jgi:hypothetical protein
VSFAIITLSVASQRVFIVIFVVVVVLFVIDPVRKLPDTPSYILFCISNLNVCLRKVIIWSVLKSFLQFLS